MKRGQFNGVLCDVLFAHCDLSRSQNIVVINVKKTVVYLQLITAK